MNGGCRILALAGSTRMDSYNKHLVRLAAEGARQGGAETTFIDLRDYPLPLFDEDLEARDGLPAAAKELRAAFLAHQGLLIASPEYNSSVPAVLKNAIDWLSRPQPGEAPLACFNGKVAAIMSASPGTLGGLRGLVHLRAILGNINVLVLPEQVAVARAHEAFAAENRLADEAQQRAVLRLGARLAEVVARLNG